MDCLDQRQMWLTLTRINQCVEIHENKTSTNGNNPSYSASSMDLYNPRSILQLLFYFVRPGSDVCAFIHLFLLFLTLNYFILVIMQKIRHLQCPLIHDGRNKFV